MYKYKLERKTTDGEWREWGTYTVEQMSKLVMAAAELGFYGYNPKTHIRIVEVSAND